NDITWCRRVECVMYPRESHNILNTSPLPLHDPRLTEVSIFPHSYQLCSAYGKQTMLTTESIGNFQLLPRSLNRCSSQIHRFGLRQETQIPTTLPLLMVVTSWSLLS